MSWTIEDTPLFVRRLKKYRKKCSNETVATLENLDTYFHTIQSGVNPMLIKAGFIHPEKKGVIAIDQSGAEGDPKQIRLYVYADEDENIVHLITIGDKSSQQKDILASHRFVLALRKARK